MRGDSRWDETWYRLREWTESRARSERLAAQILLDQGFTDLDPSHPLGGKDGTADALANRDGKSWVMAVYFARGQQTFKDIKDKFLGDYEGVQANQADALAFLTNQELRLAERRELRRAADCPVDLFHLERVVAVLDQPRMHTVRHQFLGIDAPSGELARPQRLDELWRASLARCAARWTSVGLTPTESVALAEDRRLGAVDGALCPGPAEPLVVWTAPMGSGKSIASERHHQASLERAATEASAPVPVFLAASDCRPSLQAAVEAAGVEVGEVRTAGATVVVDGVDEIGHQAASDLLTQARVLVGTWPSTTLLMTSRAVPALAEAPEHKSFPPLTEDEQEHCVEIGAGNREIVTNLYTLAEPVQATMTQPFFALLVGIWMREHSGTPQAPIDLMAMLGERATRNLAVNEKHLRALAVRSVSRELGPVPIGDVVGGVRADELLATGMLRRRGAGLVFTLPAVAQWFAAQALLLAELGAEQLLAAPEDLELWRYPLALAVSLGSSERAQELLGPLLTTEPGFALRVLDATFGQAVLGGAAPPPWREGGVQARAALQALSDSLGPLAQLTCDVDTTGRVLPMAVSSGPTHMTVAFWRSTEPRPDVFAMPAAMHPFTRGPEWGTLRGTQVGPGAAWAWAWASKGIHDRLDRVLRNRAFPVIPDGPLGHEANWAAACDLLGQSILVTHALPLSQLAQALQTVPADIYERGPVLFRKSSATHDLRGLRLIVANALARDDTELVAAVPPADRVRGGGTWIGDFYSDGRLVEVATKIYEAAIVAYSDLVARWMPTLLRQLEHHVLMPVHIVGFVSKGQRQQGFGGTPHLAGYMEALMPGSDSKVSMRVCNEGYDLSLGEPIYEQQRAARPAASRWITGTHGGMRFEIGERYPISAVVYSWLAHDLKRLGLVGALAWSRSGDATVPFDIPPASQVA